MICNPCSIAGDLVAEVRSWDVGIDTTVDSVAYKLHVRCKGKSHCDCQHKIDWTGKVINRGEEGR